jgi:hypothetical protein
MCYICNIPRCVRACECVCMCTYLCACACVWLCLCVYVYMLVCLCLCVWLCLSVYAGVLWYSLVAVAVPAAPPCSNTFDLKGEGYAVLSLCCRSLACAAGLCAGARSSVCLCTRAQV